MNLNGKMIYKLMNKIKIITYAVIISLFISANISFAEHKTILWQDILDAVAEDRIWYLGPLVDKINALFFEIDKVNVQIEALRTENTNLKQEINKLKSNDAQITKKYYRYSNNQDVFETSTNRYIGYEEAAQKDIWGEIQIIFR